MNVPKLRFKDDDGREFPEWEEKSFQDICKINQGLQIPISERFTEKDEGRYFYIGHESVTFGGFVIRGRGIAEYNPIFFNYILKTDSVRDEITQRSGGSTRYNIGQDALNVIPILLPTIPEQTKIANFFTAIDDKIAQAQTQLDAVKLYKKGLLQQLFV